jgi:hypothetical protein
MKRIAVLLVLLSSLPALPQTANARTQFASIYHTQLLTNGIDGNAWVDVDEDPLMLKIYIPLANDVDAMALHKSLIVPGQAKLRKLGFTSVRLQSAGYYEHNWDRSKQM